MPRYLRGRKERSLYFNIHRVQFVINPNSKFKALYFTHGVTVSRGVYDINEIKADSKKKDYHIPTRLRLPFEFSLNSFETVLLVRIELRISCLFFPFYINA